MFYETHLSAGATAGRVAALVVLTPSESKRLIGKAVAALPEVKNALKSGIVIVARGTTDAFAAEEIMGIAIKAKTDDYCRGSIVGGELRANHLRAEERTIGNDFVLRQGKVDKATPQEAIKEFQVGDVFIKGASAVDSSGEAAVLVGGSEGGTVGWALPAVMARGANLIVPAGLEKLVPSVPLASQKCGVLRFKYSMGLPCGLIRLINAKVVTEVQAMAILANVNATHVASGGIGGSEGSVVLALEGNAADLERAFALVKSVKGEPPIAAGRSTTPPAAGVNYDSTAMNATLKRMLASGSPPPGASSLPR